MSQVSQSFSVDGVSAALSLAPGQSATIAITGSFTGTIYIDESANPGAFWKEIISATAAFSGTVKNECAGTRWYRVRADVTPTQTVSTSDVPDAGDLNLDYDGNPITIANDEGATELQAAIREIEGLEEVVVTGSFAAGFVIVFHGVEAPETLTDDSSDLEAAMSPVTVTIDTYSATGSLSDVADVIQAFVNNEGVRVLMITDAGMESPSVTAALATLTAAVITAATITTPTFANDIMVLSGSGAPVDYTDGDPAATGEGVAGPGSIYLRTSNGKMYLNGGTKAEPLWKLVTSA